MRQHCKSAQGKATPNRQRCMHWLVVLAVAVSTLPVLADSKSEPSLYEAPCFSEVKRAGMPWCHFLWARRQVDSDYDGYYVGGGAAIGCSRGQCEEEGTWGWDYTGRLFKRRVNLGWFWIKHKQAGTGSYQPDGPRVAESIKHRLESQ